MGERDSEEENEGEGGSADRWCMGERATFLAIERNGRM